MSGKHLSWFDRHQLQTQIGKFRTQMRLYTNDDNRPHTRIVRRKSSSELYGIFHIALILMSVLLIYQ